MRRVVAEDGLVVPAAEWVTAFWARQPNRGWFLGQLALTHHFGHIYEAGITRSLVTGTWGR